MTRASTIHSGARYAPKGLGPQVSELNMFVEPRSWPIQEATYTGRYDSERLLTFRRARSHESRGGMIHAVGIGARGFKVKYVVVEPRSGPTLGATVHDQLRFDSPSVRMGSRGCDRRGGVVHVVLGPGPGFGG